MTWRADRSSLRLAGPAIQVEGITGTTTILGSRGADSTFFNRGKDPFSITAATEADSNWMMAEGAKLDTDAWQLLQNLLGHGRAHPTSACWPLFPLAQGPCSSGWHDVGRRLAVKGGGTRHRDESLIRHSRGGKHNTLISFSLDAVGPVVEGGPRMFYLSPCLDAAASVRSSVMEAT